MIIKLNNLATTVKYASYFGGNQAPNGNFYGEHVDGGTSRYDQRGIIYQSVCADCGGTQLFPITSNAWSTTNNSTNCNNGSFKFDFEISDFVIAKYNYELTGICVPLNVNFENTSYSGVNYTWYFGDGTTSNDTNPIHTYSAPGIYNAKLIAENSNTCNFSDTFLIAINIPTCLSTEIITNNYIEIYPNPAKEIVKIGNISKDRIIIELYDINGMYLQKNEIEKNSSLSIITLSQGFYTIKVLSKGNFVSIHKLIVLKN